MFPIAYLIDRPLRIYESKNILFVSGISLSRNANIKVKLMSANQLTHLQWYRSNRAGWLLLSYRLCISIWFETLRTIWYHFYNLKNLKNTNGGVVLLVKLQAKLCSFSKSNTPPWVFSSFLNFTNDTISRKASHKKEDKYC